jgi:nucleolar protein 12
LRSAPVAKLNKPKKVGVIMRDFHPDRTTCNAYVVFVEESGVDTALSLYRDGGGGTESLPGLSLDGCSLRVDGLGDKQEKNDTARTVFVGNLPFSVESEPLRRVFADCGPIHNVHVVRDSATTFGKGIAYVTFETRDGMANALLKDAFQFEGRELRVGKARPRTSTENNRKAALARLEVCRVVRCV